MLKKTFISFFIVISLFILNACDNNNTVKELSKNEIYFFYQNTCPHCHEAAKYIKNKYPDLQMITRNIRLPGNMKLFQQTIQQYNIKNAGTPLICFGNRYIMGWDDENRQLFDIYVKPYLSKNNTLQSESI